LTISDLTENDRLDEVLGPEDTSTPLPSQGTGEPDKAGIDPAGEEHTPLEEIGEDASGAPTKDNLPVQASQDQTVAESVITELGMKPVQEESESEILEHDPESRTSEENAFLESLLDNDTPKTPVMDTTEVEAPAKEDLLNQEFQDLAMEAAAVTEVNEAITEPTADAVEEAPSETITEPKAEPVQAEPESDADADSHAEETFPQESVESEPETKPEPEFESLEPDSESITNDEDAFLRSLLSNESPATQAMNPVAAEKDAPSDQVEPDAAMEEKSPDSLSSELENELDAMLAESEDVQALPEDKVAGHVSSIEPTGPLSDYKTATKAQTQVSVDESFLDRDIDTQKLMGILLAPLTLMGLFLLGVVKLIEHWFPEGRIKKVFKAFSGVMGLVLFLSGITLIMWVIFFG